jgi:CheY-like chemotaxis protein
MTAYSPELPSGTLANLPEIRTLLLDDSRFDRKRIRRIGDGLGLNLKFEEVDSVPAMQELLDRQGFDLFLIDYMLPGDDGLAALRLIRGHRGQSEAVSIMISGRADQRIAVDAIKAGCQDFILKSDMSPAFLRSAVVSALRNARPFARYFDPPKPAVTLEDMRSLLQVALHDNQLREMLRDTLQDGLRDAAQGLGYGAPQSADLMQFLLDFRGPDEFEFHQ